jgi:hypothetical protein
MHEQAVTLGRNRQGKRSGESHRQTRENHAIRAAREEKETLQQLIDLGPSGLADLTWEVSDASMYSLLRATHPSSLT